MKEAVLPCQCHHDIMRIRFQHNFVLSPGFFLCFPFWVRALLVVGKGYFPFELFISSVQCMLFLRNKYELLTGIVLCFLAVATRWSKKAASFYCMQCLAFRNMFYSEIMCYQHLKKSHETKECLFLLPKKKVVKIMFDTSDVWDKLIIGVWSSMLVCCLLFWMEKFKVLDIRMPFFF